MMVFNYVVETLWNTLSFNLLLLFFKVNWDISERQMQSHHIHFLRDKMAEINTWKIYLNVFNFRAHVCIRQLWNIKREENDNYRVHVKLFKHTRGDKKKYAEKSRHCFILSSNMIKF